MATRIIARKGALAPLALLLVLLLACGTAPAQQAAPAAGAGTPSPEAMERLRGMQLDMQELSTELQKIQEATFTANPKLQDDQVAFRDLVMARMDESGADVEATIARMETLQASLQTGELDAAAQQAALAELQADGQALQMAQAEAMADPAVEQARIALEESILAAMKMQDPRAEELITKLEAQQAAFDAALAEAMRASE